MIKEGEDITIMGFELSETPIEARKIFVDEKNAFVEYL